VDKLSTKAIGSHGAMARVCVSSFTLLSSAQIDLPFSLSFTIGCAAKSFLFYPRLDIAEHTTNGISSIQFLFSHAGDCSAIVSSLKAS
jgi:hypothetical protein